MKPQWNLVMSKPTEDLVESVCFHIVITRTQRRVIWEVWEDIQIRMMIRVADQAWKIADILEGVRPLRNV